jgi:hypothetical protein
MPSRLIPQAQYRVIKVVDLLKRISAPYAVSWKLAARAAAIAKYSVRCPAASSHHLYPELGLFLTTVSI